MLYVVYCMLTGMVANIVPMRRLVSRLSPMFLQLRVGRCILLIRGPGALYLILKWWNSGQYFGLPVTRSVVQFSLQTLIHALSSCIVVI